MSAGQRKGVCVCAVAVCRWRGLSLREKEQIDRAEREMHFSNVTLPCHPLRREKEWCELEHPERKKEIAGAEKKEHESPPF